MEEKQVSVKVSETTVKAAKKIKKEKYIPIGKQLDEAHKLYVSKQSKK